MASSVSTTNAAPPPPSPPSLAPIETSSTNTSASTSPTNTTTVETSTTATTTATTTTTTTVEAVKMESVATPHPPTASIDPRAPSVAIDLTGGPRKGAAPSVKKQPTPTASVPSTSPPKEQPNKMPLAELASAGASRRSPIPSKVSPGNEKVERHMTLAALGSKTALSKQSSPDVQSPRNTKSRIEQIGSAEHGMCLVYPPPPTTTTTTTTTAIPPPHNKHNRSIYSPQDCPAVQLLKLMDHHLSLPSVQKQLIQWMRHPNNDGSARMIQGHRSEIFVSARGKSSSCWDDIVLGTMPQLKRWSLGYDSCMNHHRHNNNNNKATKKTANHARSSRHGNPTPGDARMVPKPTRGAARNTNPPHPSDKLIHNRKAKQCLLDYCHAQAQQDPRLTTASSSKKYRLENFSLLVSLGKSSPAQTPHIDLVTPNVQFGVLVSDGAEGTHFVPEHGSERLPHIKCPQDLMTLWETNPVFQDDNHNDTPPTAAIQNILEALQTNDGAQQLLQYFGNVLHPEATLRADMVSPKNLPVGTLACLPGSVVHCGPASKKPRTVLFFSGAPIVNKKKAGKDAAAAAAAVPEQPEETQQSNTTTTATTTVEPVVDPYQPDSQYNGPTLATNLVSILWRMDGIDYPERRYLLHRLVQYVESTTAKEITALLGEGDLNDFVKKIQTKKYGTNKTKQQLIEEAARNVDLYFHSDPFSQTENVIDESQLVLISSEDLWEMPNPEDGDGAGPPMNTLVYRNVVHDRIVLRFMTAKSESENPSIYEGLEDPYTLTMNEGAEGQLFDGNNGVLKDDEGNIIHLEQISRKKAAKQRKKPAKKRAASPSGSKSRKKRKA